MTALFDSAWSGMALIDDLNRGVTARFLVSAVPRAALISGRIVKEAVVVVIQSVIIVALALIDGGTFPGGAWGVLALFGMAALLGAAFAALSNGFALIMRHEEALIGAVQFIVLPLTFLDDVPGGQPDAELDPPPGGLQLGQLGGDRRALGDLDERGLGSCCSPGRIPRGAACGLPDLRNAGVPCLPAVGLAPLPLMARPDFRRGARRQLAPPAPDGWPRCRAGRIRVLRLG